MIMPTIQLGTHQNKKEEKTFDKFVQENHSEYLLNNDQSTRYRPKHIKYKHKLTLT